MSDLASHLVPRPARGAAAFVLLTALLAAQEKPKTVPAVPMQAGTGAAKTRRDLGFSPSMLRYHSGDALPDFPVLLADGSRVPFGQLRGKAATLVVMLPDVGGERFAPVLVGAQAASERYAHYGVQVVVGGLWSTSADFLAAAKAQAGKWSFKLFGDPAGPYTGPSDDQDARMAHHRETVMGQLFQGGMTTPLPASFVVGGDGTFVGTFTLRDDKVPYDGIANLLLRAGVALDARDMPAVVAEASVFAKPAPRPPEAPVTLIEVGSQAPDFAMVDADGKTVRLSDYAGKVVVLDFWATWCGPCKAALPHVQEVAAEYADQGVVVLASCTNDGRDDFVQFVRAQGDSLANVHFACDPLERSPERASRKLYGVSGIPQQFVIGKDGKIASTVEGYMKGEVLLDAALAAAGVQVEAAIQQQAEQDRQKREALKKGRPTPALPLRKGN